MNDMLKTKGELQIMRYDIVDEYDWFGLVGCV